MMKMRPPSSEFELGQNCEIFVLFDSIPPKKLFNMVPLGPQFQIFFWCCSSKVPSSPCLFLGSRVKKGKPSFSVKIKVEFIRFFTVKDLGSLHLGRKYLHSEEKRHSNSDTRRISSQFFQLFHNSGCTKGISQIICIWH